MHLEFLAKVFPLALDTRLRVRRVAVQYGTAFSRTESIQYIWGQTPPSTGVTSILEGRVGSGEEGKEVINV